MKHTLIVAALLTVLASGADAAPLAESLAPASYTQAQANAGQAEYIANCVDCHGKNLNDGEFGGPPLVGENFRDKWLAQPAGNLVGFVAGAMPPEAPGRLPIETYAEIVAYILSVNGVAASKHELTADGAAKPVAPRQP